MQIDWNQTLVGSDGLEGAMPDGAESLTVRLALSLQAGRITGILFAATLFGLAIALSPLRGKERSIIDAVAISGLLASQVVGFGLVLRHGLSGFLPAALAGTLMLLFAFALGLAPPVSAALVLIVAAETLLSLVSRKLCRPQTLAALAGIPIVIGAGGVVLAYPDAGGAALILGAILPSIVMLVLVLRHPAQSTARDTPNAAAVNAALLVAATQDLAGSQIITDATGSILSPAQGAPFMQYLGHDYLGHDFGSDAAGGTSLVERTMISDRPSLLQALSRAAHSGQSSAAFEIRLRENTGDEHMAAPPRYLPQRCKVMPAAGLPGHAVVMLSPFEETAAAGSGITPEQAMLHRALHDCVSPFNAGLGYLEVLRDPHLAPHDLATFRNYAGEAHKAITDAHRNAVLMGRWLRLTGQPRAARNVISPDAFAQDAIRAFNLADRDDVPRIIVIPSPGLSKITLSVDASRFALQVLLRAAMHDCEPGERIELRLEARGADLMIILAGPEPKRSSQNQDIFQSAVERAAASFADLAFEADRPGLHCLIIRDAVVMQAPRPAPVAGLSLRRLAS